MSVQSIVTGSTLGRGAFTLRMGLLAGAFALATAWFGWMAVPALGLAWGWVDRSGAWPAWTAGGSAGLAWSGWLLWSGIDGPVLELADRVGAVVRVPGPLLLLATIGFATILAASGAAFVRWASRRE